MNDFQSTCGIFEEAGKNQSQEIKVVSYNDNNENVTALNKIGREHVSNNIKRCDGSRNRKNEPCGFGNALLSDGDVYEGTFRKGLYHGAGVLKHRNGHRYEGGFRRGLRHGRGTQTYPDCSTYDGDWWKGDRWGYGVYLYSNKDCFEGNWLCNRKHGIGMYTFAENGIRLRGAWDTGILKGPVEILFGDVRYYGTWSGLGLSEQEESVFNIASKYLVRGVMKLGSFDEYVWTPRALERYSFASLPLEPLPVPIPMMHTTDSSSSDSSSTDSLKFN